MLAAATYSATDPDEYAAMIRGARVEVVLAERGDFAATVTRIDLDRLWMQRGHESMARTFRGVTPANRMILWFPAAPQPPVRIVAEPIGDGEIAILAPGMAGAWRSSAPSRWASMSLPTEEFLGQGSALTGRDLASKEVVRVLRPSALTRDRLICLHAATFDLAQLSPKSLGHPDAIRCLEQSLIQTAFAAIGGDETQAAVPLYRHRQVMTRFEALLEKNPDRAIYIAEVCAAVGVSDRSLRVIFQDRVGISPNRYLWLRRMHLARRALQIAAPASTTVTDVAMQHGFFELGRFAVTYRQLFAESPSATLRRAPNFGPTANEASLARDHIRWP